jgi:two-component system response regulator HydG
LPVAQLASFHGMVGRSAAMRALFQRIERVTAFDVPVLIRGETGTGKELVARAIWQRSARRDRRFETVNAGALNPELLLSELFGHERGAFTGAVVRKSGLLVVADGGTVFLDEVGDLPLDAQVMLLRFLQSREIRPVGSTETKRIDVRLIAATHRDLDIAVERGTFREDLYYRLHRGVLDVPPLRYRPDDIPLLVEHVLGQLRDRYGLGVLGVTRDALRVLTQHAWRGNVRELEAVLEQAVIFARGDLVTAEDLGLGTQRRPSGGSQAEAEPERRADATGALSWLQHEALRIAAERRELRRRELIARFRVSREVARRELAGLVHRGLLRLVGRGRGARYVPLSFWLALLGEAIGWGAALV